MKKTFIQLMTKDYAPIRDYIEFELIKDHYKSFYLFGHRIWYNKFYWLKNIDLQMYYHTGKTVKEAIFHTIDILDSKVYFFLLHPELYYSINKESEHQITETLKPLIDTSKRVSRGEDEWKCSHYSCDVSISAYECNDGRLFLGDTRLFEGEPDLLILGKEESAKK